MFRADNKKIATGFLHAFDNLMSGSYSLRVPVWNGAPGVMQLRPGTIRDDITRGLVGIGVMPTAGSGTLQVGGATGSISAQSYCDAYGLNCFNPSSLGD